MRHRNSKWILKPSWCRKLGLYWNLWVKSLCIFVWILFRIFLSILGSLNWTIPPGTFPGIFWIICKHWTMGMFERLLMDVCFIRNTYTCIPKLKPFLCLVGKSKLRRKVKNSWLWMSANYFLLREVIKMGSFRSDWPWGRGSDYFPGSQCDFYSF